MTWVTSIAISCLGALWIVACSDGERAADGTGKDESSAKSGSASGDTEPESGSGTSDATASDEGSTGGASPEVAPEVPPDEQKAADLSCPANSPGGTCAKELGALKIVKASLTKTAEKCDLRAVAVALSAAFVGEVACPAGYTMMNAGANCQVGYGGDYVGVEHLNASSARVRCCSSSNAQQNSYEYIYGICIKQDFAN